MAPAGRRSRIPSSLSRQAGSKQSVGRGEVAVPADAQVIDVRGKTVLPGFIDGHGHLEDFHGELYLHLGITTCANIELYQDGPWTLAQKQGTDLGKIRGPRIWMSGRAIGGVSTGHDAFGSRTARDNIIVTNGGRGAQSGAAEKGTRLRHPQGQ